MLETIRLFDPREQGIWKRTTEVAYILTSIKKDDPVFNSETVKKTVELIVATDQCHLPEADREKVNVHRHVIMALLHLFRIVSSSTKVEDNTLRSLYQLVRRDGRDNSG